MIVTLPPGVLLYRGVQLYYPSAEYDLAIQQNTKIEDSDAKYQGKNPFTANPQTISKKTFLGYPIFRPDLKECAAPALRAKPTYFARDLEVAALYAIGDVAGRPVFINPSACGVITTYQVKKPLKMLHIKANDENVVGLLRKYAPEAFAGMYNYEEVNYRWNDKKKRLERWSTSLWDNAMMKEFCVSADLDGIISDPMLDLTTNHTFHGEVVLCNPTGGKLEKVSEEQFTYNDLVKPIITGCLSAVEPQDCVEEKFKSWQKTRTKKKSK